MVPAPDKMSAEGHVYGREFVKQFGIRRFHDVGPDQGISHAVVADRAYALPGSVLVCGDSHTCASGAFNCAARGVGGPDLLGAVTTGKTWFYVGETVRYDLLGPLRPGVSPRTSSFISRARYGHHTNQNIEFGGPGLAHLGINARRTIATMGAELSAEFATFEADRPCSTMCEPVIPRRLKRKTPTPMPATSTAVRSISSRWNRWSPCRIR